MKDILTTSPEELRDRIEFQDLNSLSQEHRFSQIIEDLDGISISDNTYLPIIQASAEKHEMPFHKAAVFDFSNLQEDLVELSAEVLENDYDKPSLAGGDYAGRALEAVEGLGFETDRIGYLMTSDIYWNDEFNSSVMAGPGKIQKMTDIPSEYVRDDQFHILFPEKEKLGLTSDDPTVFPKYLEYMVAASEEIETDKEFLLGMHEAIESYNQDYQ